MILTNENNISFYEICNSEKVIKNRQEKFNIGSHKVVKMERSNINGVINFSCLQKDNNGKSLYRVRIRKNLLTKNWVLV